MFTIVIGNHFHTFGLFGLFETHEDAEGHAEMYYQDQVWEVVEIHNT